MTYLPIISMMCKYASVSTYNKVERVPPKNFHLIFIYYLNYHINLFVED